MTLPPRALRSALFAGAALAAAPHIAVAADEAADAPTVSGVTVQPSAQPRADLPLSVRSIDAEQIAATVNAVTAEDALKYLPDIFIRRRHIGDTQAPMTTRTSGVGSSARSLIYADGVLLSALIGNNNTSASPRWGMVAPEEIQRIDVMYGPFSAAYPGNSIGAVVNITTRMPQAFETTAKVGIGTQHFSQYGTKDDYPVYEAAASMGDRRGAFAWRLSLNHVESQGQPLSYVTAARSTTAAAATATPVTGAFDDRNRTGAPIVVLGAGGLEHQRQDNAKLRLEWSPTSWLTASYMVGYFGNRTDAQAQTYLSDATGTPAYSGALNIGGQSYSIPASAFASGVYRLDERHWLQALSLRGEAGPHLTWTAVATLYDYGRDELRAPSAALPGAQAGGPGSITDMSGTGWRTYDAKAVWTPEGALAAHAISLGLHTDSYELGTDRYNTTDWMLGGRGGLAASSHGKTQTDAIYLEDAVRLRPDLSLTVGVRQEHWRAFNGLNYSLTPAQSVQQPKLSADRTSPKAVLAWTPNVDWRVTASAGEAYRFPTVSELYQTVTTGLPGTLFVPNPNLAPERAISTELSVQRSWRHASLRLSAFTEDVTNALISQSGTDPQGAAVTFVQNVDKVRSRGVEAVAEAHDVLIEGLDLSASATYVDSITARDAANAAAVGKQTPQLPRWRWTAVATWRATDKLTLTTAARYSDRPYGTLENSDTNGHTFQGFEGYFVVDARATYRIDAHWSAALGVDNLNNNKYFLFHPFPQRSVLAELRYVY
jgi:iron complex outermembrane receptor protein